jgi:hypothetical protein
MTRTEQRLVVDMDGGGSGSCRHEARKWDGMSSRGHRLQRRGGTLECHGQGHGSGSTLRRALSKWDGAEELDAAHLLDMGGVAPA